MGIGRDGDLLPDQRPGWVVAGESKLPLLLELPEPEELPDVDPSDDDPRLDEDPPEDPPDADPSDDDPPRPQPPLEGRSVVAGLSWGGAAGSLVRVGSSRVRVGVV